MAILNLLGFSTREGDERDIRLPPFLPTSGRLTERMASPRPTNMEDVFETFVVSEILKSFWHRMRLPELYFYRDRDGKEVDLLIEHDGRLHGVEVKLGASPRRSWTRTFAPLGRLDLPVADCAVVSLAPELSPLDERVWAVPVGLL